MTLTAIAVGVWLAGVMYFGLQLIASLLHLRGITCRATAISSGPAASTISCLTRLFEVDPVRVVVSCEIDRPLLWGWRQPILLLPINHIDWSDDDLEMIVTHECAHAARWDHRSRILLAVMRCNYWFHPVSWMLERLGGTLAEYAADDMSIDHGRSALSLGDCLLRFAGSPPRLPSLSFASFRALRNRLERLTVPRANPSQVDLPSRATITAMAIGTAVLLSLGIGTGSPRNILAATEILSSSPALRSKDPLSIREVIARMNAIPGWEHLPLDLEEQVAGQFLSGPEFNVDVTLLDEQGDPVMNALCALVENDFERTNRRGYLRSSNRIEELPLALGISDPNGGFAFQKIRGRQPSVSRNGIVGAVMVVLHPEYGIRYATLARTNRNQTMKLTLEAGVNLSGDVAMEDGTTISNLPLNVTLSNVSEERAPAFFEAQFGSSILVPRLVTQADGSYTIVGLPPKGHCVYVFPDYRVAGFELADRQGSQQFVPTNSLRHDLMVRSSERPNLVFRCVDAHGIEQPPAPLVGHQFGDERPVEIDADDNYVTRRYVMSGDGAGGKVYGMDLKMPLPWISLRHFRLSTDCDEPFEIQMTRGRVVRGKILDAETRRPLSGVDVWALKQDSIKAEDQPRWPQDYLSAKSQTNADGVFEFAISNDAWSLFLDGPIYGYELPASMVGEGMPAISRQLPPGEPLPEGNTDLDLVYFLKPSPRIRGRVVTDDMQPVPGAMVSCSYQVTERNESFTFADDRGEFELLPPPTRFAPSPAAQKALELLRGRPEPPDDFRCRIEVQCAQGFASLLLPENIDAQLQSNLEIRLHPKSEERLVEGRISLDGRGWEGIEVGIGNINARRISSGPDFAWANEGLPNVWSRTDEKGRYRIVVRDPEKGIARFSIRLPEEFPLQKNPYSRNRKFIEIREQTNEGPSLEYFSKPGDQVIRGQIKSPNGKPFTGARVRLRIENENAIWLGDPERMYKAKLSDAEGRFEFTDLPSTSYRLDVDSGAEGRSIWNTQVTQTCEAGETDVVVILDESVSKKPEKIIPKSIR